MPCETREILRLLESKLCLSACRNCPAKMLRTKLMFFFRLDCICPTYAFIFCTKYEFIACHAGQGPLRIMSLNAAKIIGTNTVKYYAHTATLPDGTNAPNTERWQLLSAHLRNVADLAEKFAVSLNLGVEAKLAGLLHDRSEERRG